MLHTLTTTILAASLCIAPCAAQEQAYPDRAIHLIATYTSGGIVDILARIVADTLSQSLAQPVIVENRPGAGGTIGIAALARAPHDGYTLALATTGPLAISPSLHGDLAYRTPDIAPIARVATSPQLLVVSASLPVRSVRELVAYAKAHPHALNFGSPGVGTTAHLAGELFKSAAGIDIVHVAYRGNRDALKDAVAGRVQILFSPAATVLPFVESGKLRVLGVAAATRSPLLPRVPTLAEAGFAGTEAVAWYGLVAPSGTPRPVIERLHADLARAVARADFRARLAAIGAEPAVSTPSEFAALIDGEARRWKRIVVRLGLAKN
ncbi:MAG TPA: tripartite tricarboxylate transporter substrate binding protein [Casimicrobiaceae bacterium]